MKNITINKGKHFVGGLEDIDTIKISKQYDNPGILTEMKANTIDELSIKDLYELSNDKSLNNFAKGYLTEQFRQRVFKYIKIGTIIVVLLISLICIAIGLTRDVEAKYTQSAKVCNSEKCLTRFKYIEEAKTKHKSKEAIVEYVLIRTVFNRKKVPTVSEYREIKNEISNLYDLTNSNWKDNTVKIIKQYEGKHLTAYCDRLIRKGNRYIKSCPTGKERYSIGYGTKSYRGEVITEEEVEKRLKTHLESAVYPNIEGLTCWDDNQKTAIADFMYNAGVYKRHSKTKKPFIEYVKNCDKEQVKGFLDPKNYPSKGIKVRRQAQLNYFINNI